MSLSLVELCYGGIINCPQTKFGAIIVNVLVFFDAKFSLDCFCAVLLEHSLTSQVTFSRYRSSFLSDLYCSRSELKLAEIKSIAA